MVCFVTPMSAASSDGVSARSDGEVTLRLTTVNAGEVIMAAERDFGA